MCVSYTLYETDHLLIVSAPLTENLQDQSAKFSVLGLDWVVVTFLYIKALSVAAELQRHHSDPT